MKVKDVMHKGVTSIEQNTPVREIAKRMRLFTKWSTDLRYETGRRDTGETVAFLKTAKMIFEWVEGHLP